MLDIKPFKQGDDSLCGPASIKMVLDYYEIEASEADIAKRCDHAYERGCDDAGMRRALESYGLEVEIWNNSNFEDIEHWLSHKVPVIVDWFSPGYNAGLGDLSNGHSSIVIDLDEKYIHLMDPEFGGIRKILRDDFMRCWFDWRAPFIKNWEDMIIRQLIAAYK